MRFEHELLGLENPLDPGAYAYLPALPRTGLARSLTAMLRREAGAAGHGGAARQGRSGGPTRTSPAAAPSGARSARHPAGPC
ncbi:MAG: hypothetical protein R3E96_04040 [Planctomycetota bacterium]